VPPPALISADNASHFDILSNMGKTAYPPIIEPRLRTSVPRRRIRAAVKRMADLRKNDPAAYRALIERTANQTVRIVPG
jgi:hypothetical protein